MTPDAPKVRPITAKAPMKEKRSFLIGAIDTETSDLDGELLLCQAYHETWPDAGLWRKAPDMLADIFSMDAKTLRKTIWYVHNIDYDLRYIFSHLKALDVQLDCRQRAPGKFYEIRVLSSTLKDKSGRPLLVTRFRDSTAIYEGTLKTFTEQFAPAFAKKDIGLGRGVIFNPADPVHRDYARFDVLGLVSAIKGFDGVVFEHYSSHIKGTGSSTAYAAWLRTLGPDDAFYRQSPRKEAFFRECYYGGLVQMNCGHGREYEKIRTFDINSSYPAAMRSGLPAGSARWTPTYKPGFPGFYRITVTIPDDAQMPIFPQRIGKNLSWPRGAFTTQVSSLEIEYGRELGYAIIVHSGFYFPDGLDFRFNAFVDKAEALRKAFKKTPTEIVAKRMQNSLYGRFGMKEEGEECAVSFDGCPDGFLPVIDERDGSIVSEIYWRKVKREAEYMMPHISAWITAGARINIDRMCRAIGIEKILYRDTDSMAVYGSPSAAYQFVGPEYGKLKDEGEKFRIKYHAPKCYSYFDAEGEPHAVYKGIPEKLLKPDERDPLDLYRERLATIHAGRKLIVEYHSSTSLKTHWRSGAMFVMRTRASTDVEKIYSHVIEAGMFRPRIAG